MPIELKTQELNGKLIGFCSDTEFLVQVGKGPKGKYFTHFRTKGNLTQAVLLYNGINIGNGYKKRLISWALNKPLLARAFS